MKKNELILIIFILLILGVVIWGITIYVPPVKGRVVDAETGKPMKGVNVRAGWVTGYADPGGGSFKTFKVYATKTDENGEFALPWRIKLKIPVVERYRGVDILIYEHGYSGFYKDIFGNALYIAPHKYISKVYGNFIDIKLPLIKLDKEYLENILEINARFSDVGADRSFIIDERRMFPIKFPTSILLDENQFLLAAYYMDRLKDYKSALREYQIFLKKYPNSKYLQMVRKDIAELNKKIRQQSK